MPATTKLAERSVEYDLLEFLRSFEDSPGLPAHAFTGGLAFASYFGHCPRRLSDIDMVAGKNDMSELLDALLAHGFQRTTTPRMHIITECHCAFHFFDVDIHTDRIVLALPEDWRELGAYDLRPALQARQLGRITSLDGAVSVAIPVVPKEHHLLMKLLCPLEPHNVHDIAFVLAITPWDDASHIAVTNAYSQADRDVRVLMRSRLRDVHRAIPGTIWARSMDSQVLARLDTRMTRLLGEFT